jgi:hypothetical protein
VTRLERIAELVGKKLTGKSVVHFVIKPSNQPSAAVSCCAGTEAPITITPSLALPLSENVMKRPSSSGAEMDAAAQAILLQTDQILVKSMNIPALIEVIEQRLASGPVPSRVIESVATILEYSIESTIDAWYERVKKDKKLTTVSMSREQRVGHLPRIMIDLVRRLRAFEALGSRELVSGAAEEHGRFRRQQGYSAEMMVEESRMLQVSIFETLQKNRASIDFSILLNSVMTIADEVDSQLSQAMHSYVEESLFEGTPA